MGTITFWDENGGKGNQIGETLSSEKSYAIDCRKGDLGFRDNRIRSIRLKNLPAWTSIALYDKHDGRTDYNWAKVSVTEDMTEEDGELIVSSVNSLGYVGKYGKVVIEPMPPEFNQDLGYQIGAHRLDGRVSCIRVDFCKLTPIDPELAAELGLNDW